MIGCVRNTRIGCRRTRQDECSVREPWVPRWVQPQRPVRCRTDAAPRPPIGAVGTTMAASHAPSPDLRRALSRSTPGTGRTRRRKIDAESGHREDRRTEGIRWPAIRQGIEGVLKVTEHQGRARAGATHGRRDDCARCPQGSRSETCFVGSVRSTGSARMRGDVENVECGAKAADFGPRWTSKTGQYDQMVILAGFDPSIEASDDGPVAKGFHEHSRVAVTIPCAILIRILRNHLSRLRTVRRPGSGTEQQ